MYEDVFKNLLNANKKYTDIQIEKIGDIRGNKIISVDILPTSGDFKTGDLAFIKSTGDIYQYQIDNWVFQANIKGSGSVTQQDILDAIAETDINAKTLNGKQDIAFATSIQGTKADNAVPKTTTINSKALTGNITITKSDVSLGNVDNTSDANKPVSTATTTALNAKVDKTIKINNKPLSSDVTLLVSDITSAVDLTTAQILQNKTIKNSILDEEIYAQNSQFIIEREKEGIPEPNGWHEPKPFLYTTENTGLGSDVILKYLKDPIDNQDAVNKQYLINKLNNIELQSNSISDLNNAIQTGFYNCYSAENAPSDGFYTIEVNTDGANVIQRATNANRETYQRIGYDVQNDPSWSEWTGNGISQTIIDQIKAEVKAEIFEEEHEVGDLFYTTKVDVNPNNKFPNMVWERWDSNYYIVSAGDGINGKQEVGTNSYTLTTSQLPVHNHTLNNATHVHSNNHGHNLTNNEDTTRMLVYKGTGISGTQRTLPAQNSSGTAVITNETTITNYTGNTGNPTTTLSINNNGSGASIDNRPRSYGVYIWERVA